jgi:hypothetical protein
MLVCAGSHFKAHKDTIRDVKHFGSLIVFFPSSESMDEKEFDLSKCH